MTIAGDVLSERHVRLARSVGALSELPLALNRVHSCCCSPVSWLPQPR